MHFLLYIKYSENNWCWNKSAENWNIIHRCEDRQNSVRTPMSYTSNAMWTLLTSLLKGCYYITCRVKNYLSQQNLIIWQFLYKFQLGLSIVTINLWNQRLAARRRHSRLVAPTIKSIFPTHNSFSYLLSSLFTFNSQRKVTDS